MVPALLKIQYAHLPFYAGIKSIFTIHNLQYQGIFGIRKCRTCSAWATDLWSSAKLECNGCANFMKAGLVYSDAISHRLPKPTPRRSPRPITASGGRADSRPEGFALRGAHGIDVAEYDPEHDSADLKPFSLSKLEGKAENKRRCSRTLGLRWTRMFP
jgi:starch synthase